jgi:hypothetical protein
MFSAGKVSALYGSAVQICCNVVDRGSSYKPYALLVMAVSRTAGSGRKKGRGVFWSARSMHEPTREHAARNVKTILRCIGYVYHEYMISVYCVLRQGMHRVYPDLLVSTFLRCVDKHNDSVQGMSVEFGAEARTRSAPSETEQLLSMLISCVALKGPLPSYQQSSIIV